MVMGMGVPVRLVDQFAGGFLHAIGENDVDFGCPQPATVHLSYSNGHIGKAEASRHLLEPFRGCPGRDESSEQHVAADPRDRVQDSKASI